jgi:hypothetical protein
MRANSIVFTLLFAACSMRPGARTPFDVNAEEISRLNGNWVGEYSSAATGRSGSIVFALTGDQKSASGDVVMYPTIVTVPADAVTSARASHAADVLTINIVRATDDVVTGKLDAYRDPATGATLTTTFTGRMAGDTIEGTYESLSSGSTTPQRGKWRVKRQ